MAGGRDPKKLKVQKFLKSKAEQQPLELNQSCVFGEVFGWRKPKL